MDAAEYSTVRREIGADCATRSRRCGWVALALTVASGALFGADLNADTQAAPAAVTSPEVPRQHRGASLEDHVRILTQALDLDAKQQAELRKLLQSQREQIQRVWSDTSVPAAYRVNATRMISDQTADQIRAMLNEEQKKKYNPPRQPHEPVTDPSSRTVEEWMKATN